MQDQNLTKVTAFPAAGATSNPTGLDTKTGPVTGPVDGQAQFNIAAPATPSLADTKTIIYTIEHSDSPSSGFAAIPGVANHISTGASGAGAAAVNEFRHIPKNTKRYIRCTAAVLSAGGDSTALSYTFSVHLHNSR